MRKNHQKQSKRRSAQLLKQQHRLQDQSRYLKDFRIHMRSVLRYSSRRSAESLIKKVPKRFQGAAIMLFYKLYRKERERRLFGSSIR